MSIEQFSRLTGLYATNPQPSARQASKCMTLTSLRYTDVQTSSYADAQSVQAALSCQMGKPTPTLPSPLGCLQLSQMTDCRSAGLDLEVIPSLFLPTWIRQSGYLSATRSYVSHV